MAQLTLTLDPVIHLDDEQMLQLCSHNPDLKFERNARGDLIIMESTGGETGIRNSEITAELVNWNRQERSGQVFDSSTLFRLPNGAARSPDAAWLPNDRWRQLTPEQRAKFPPLCPDFVLELRSPGDSLTDLQAKLQEYIDGGARLGWLIDPQNKRVEIYRPDRPPEVLEDPEFLSGESVLPGFQFDLSLIWGREDPLG